MPWMIPYCAIIGAEYGKLKVLNNRRKKKATDRIGW